MSTRPTRTTEARKAYKVREAAELTSYGYDRLVEFIKSGELKAKRDVNDKGEPVGPYRILAADLDAFLDSRPAA